MGKFSHRFVAAIADNIGRSKFSRKKLLLSIVSLVLATVVLISSTVCWYMLIKATGKSDEISLNTDNGLRINDLGESFEKIAADSFIRPASSIDGRNIYFPADGESFSNQTANMIFRNANAGDKNDGYIQYDFELTAEENYTSVYLDTLTHTDSNNQEVPNTFLYFEGWNSSNAETASEAKKNSNALRAAIYYEGIENNTPIVFSPQKAIRTTNAVSEIDSNDGSFLSVGEQKAFPFKDYAYGKKPIAVMDRGERRRFSLIIWLEGTDKYCVDSLAGKKIELNFKFTTSWENTDRISFVDKSSNHEVQSLLNSAGNNYALALFYDDANHNIEHYRFNLYTDTEQTITNTQDPNYPRDVWYCNIPGTATSLLKFAIIDLNNFNSSNPNPSMVKVWEETGTGQSTLNRIDSTVYINDSEDLASSAYGHWHDGDIEDYGGGHDIGDIDDGDW